MRNGKKILAALLVLSMLLALCGCSNAKDVKAIKNTLSEFEYGCRNMDLNVILNCLNPSYADPIKLGMAIANMANYDVQEKLEELVGKMFGNEYAATDFLSKLSIEEPEVKVDDNTAVVTCKLRFEIAGQSFTKGATIKMVEKNENWYVDPLGIRLS